MALVALGQAEETERGAIPRAAPQLPFVLPRWDDICVVVLRLAEQQGQLEYRARDGSLPPSRGGTFVVRALNAPPPPAPNIAAAYSLGPARAAAEVLMVLEALGLVGQGRWTEASETVLWRDPPSHWDIDVVSDPRFARAVEQALATMPEGISAEMDRLVAISEEDIQEAIDQSVASYKELRARYGSKARLGQPFSTEKARESVVFMRRNDLDWLFFRYWRLGNGWLSFHEAGRALEIFHDPLAIAMRRAVIMKRYPDLLFMAS